MTNDEQTYDLGAIRQLLLAAFTPEELRRFCEDRPIFRPIMNRFGRPYRLDDMVDELITYCRTHLLFDELLVEVKEHNPRQYARFFEPGPSAVELEESQEDQPAETAFELPGTSPPMKVDPTVGQVLEEVSLLHQQKVAKTAEEERLVQMREEELKIDLYQQDQLMKGIRQWVDSFNAQSSLGDITIRRAGSPTAPFEYYFDIPGTGWVKLSFRRLDPPLELTRGFVRAFAYLADEDGVGFNYLLVRKDENDIYGDWQICRVDHNPISMRDNSRRAPGTFGFETHVEFSKEMRHSERGMHIYTYKFAPADSAQFAEIVRDFIKRRRASHN